MRIGHAQVRLVSRAVRRAPSWNARSSAPPDLRPPVELRLRRRRGGHPGRRPAAAARRAIRARHLVAVPLALRHGRWRGAPIGAPGGGGVLLQVVQFGGVYGGFALGVPAALSALVMLGLSPLVTTGLAVAIGHERGDARLWTGLASASSGSRSASRRSSASARVGVGIARDAARHARARGRHRRAEALGRRRRRPRLGRRAVGHRRRRSCPPGRRRLRRPLRRLPAARALARLAGLGDGHRHAAAARPPAPGLRREHRRRPAARRPGGDRDRVGARPWARRSIRRASSGWWSRSSVSARSSAARRRRRARDERSRAPGLVAALAGVPARLAARRDLQPAPFVAGAPRTGPRTPSRAPDPLLDRWLARRPVADDERRRCRRGLGPVPGGPSSRTPCRRAARPGRARRSRRAGGRRGAARPPRRRASRPARARRAHGARRPAGAGRRAARGVDAGRGRRSR